MAQSVRIVAGGKRMNRIRMRADQMNLTLAASGLTALGTPDTQFGVINIADNLPSKAARWSSNAGGEGFTFDARLMLNGDFETVFVGGHPAAGWASNGATATRETTAGLFQTGAAALRVAGIGNLAEYYDIVCTPGDKLQFKAGGRKVSAGGSNAEVRVQNLATGSYLTAGGAWQAGVTGIFSTAGTAYVNATVVAQVESFAACQTTDVVIRVQFMSGGVGTDNVYDDAQVVPGIDSVSVIGAGVSASNSISNFGSVNSGLAPQTVIEVRSGSDGTVFATVAATMSVRSPSFYSVFTIAYANFWKFLITTAQPIPVGATSVAVFLGEVVFGQTLLLARGIDGAIDITLRDPQQDSPSRYGEVRTAILTSGPKYDIGVKFKYPALTDFQEARDAVWRVSRNGAYPFVLIPDDQNPDLIVFGVPSSDDFSVKGKTRQWHESASWTMISSPMPQFI
jgi:hypothetical protein